MKAADTSILVYQFWKSLLVLGPDNAGQRLAHLPGTIVPPLLAPLVDVLGDKKALGQFFLENQSIEKDATGWDALFFGLGRMILGRIGLAQGLFETASDTLACKVPALVYLAKIYLGRNCLELAKKAIQEGLELNPEIGEFHLTKSRLLMRNNALDQADKEIETARKKGGCSLFGLAGTELELRVIQDRQDEAVRLGVTFLREGIEGRNREETAGLCLNTLITCGALDEAENYLDQALEEDPDSLLFLNFRAEIASLRGQFRLAGAAVNKGLHLDDTQVPLLLKKAALAGKIFNQEQGFEALDRVMELTREQPNKERASFQALYGDIHFDGDDLSEAILAYEKALEKDPDCIQALGGLAQVMAVQGDLGRARIFQDKIYDLAPVKAVQMMILQDMFVDNPLDIDRISTLAEKPGISPSLKASLNLSLAKAHQAKENHSKAMAYADTANAAFCTFVSFDPRQEMKQANQIIARMTRDFFNSRQDFGSFCDLPVFVLGMPRSGTTLVEQILGSHSKIFPGGELGLIPRMWRRLMAWEHRLGSPFCRIPDCSLELNCHQSLKFSNKLEDEYLELMPQGSEKHITDKLPHNFKNIGLIKLLFPKAKIIYCRRHAGGIALSNYFTDYQARHGGMGFAYDLTWIGAEISNCQRLMAHWESIFPDTIHIVDYETLVENPKSEVKRMLAFLDLSWEEPVMTFNQLKRPVKTASLVQVRKPMYTTSKDRWRWYKKELAPMFDALERHNSDPLPEPVSLPDHEPNLFLKGMDLLEAGNHFEAAKIFKEILDLYPRHAAAMHMLGAALSFTGKIELALTLMKESIRLHPGNPTWYENLAAMQDHLYQTKEALKTRNRGRAITGNPMYVPEQSYEPGRL